MYQALKQLAFDLQCLSIVTGVAVVGWTCLYWLGLRHMMPVKEALGIVKPQKPLLSEKREEIERIKRHRANLESSFR